MDAVGRSVVWLALCACLGCGGDSGGDEDAEVAPFASGERLRAVYWDGGGGATALRHWHDRELGIDCRIVEDLAGDLRCMPLRSAYPVYLSPGCTEPAMEWNTGPCDPGEQPTLVAVNDLRTCGNRWEGFGVGAEVTRMTSYRRGNLGNCTQIDHPEPQTFLPLMALDPGMLAQASIRRIELDNGLGVDVAEFAGGGHEVLRSVVLAQDAACIVTEINGARRCLAGTRGYDFGDTHSDDTCTGEDVAWTRACDAPDVIMKARQGTGECATYELQGLYAAGSRLEATDVYEGASASCEPARDDGRTFWTVGPELDSEMPETTLGWRGDGRLQVQHDATPEGARLTPRLSFRDTDADRECYTYELGSFGIRCIADLVGRPGSNVLEFADAGCTQELVRVGIPSCGDKFVPAIYLEEEVGTCGPEALTGAREVGALFTGQLYRGDIAGTYCDPAETPDSTEFYQLGAEISLADYPEIRVVSD